MELRFYEEEDKLLPNEIKAAVTAMQDLNWKDFRNIFMPTFYDICCGLGRRVCLSTLISLDISSFTT